MSVQIVEINCPGCGAPVALETTKCKYCSRPIVIKTFNDMNNYIINQFYTFNYDGKFFYYDFCKKVIMQVSEKLFDIINKYSLGQALIDEEKSYLYELKNYGLINQTSCGDVDVSRGTSRRYASLCSSLERVVIIIGSNACRSDVE